MSNPYQSPAIDSQQPLGQAASLPAVRSNYNWVRQVRIFAILNAIQGALEVVMGILLLSMAVALPLLVRNQTPKGGQGPTETYFWAIAAVYLGIGIPVLVSGVLRIVAALRNNQYRGRVLGIISIVAGLGSVLSCYCAPTAIGLLVYGLMIYLHPAVKAAFAMGDAGHSAANILVAFDPAQIGRPNAADGGQNPFA